MSGHIAQLTNTFITIHDRYHITSCTIWSSYVTDTAIPRQCIATTLLPCAIHTGTSTAFQIVIP